MSFTKYLSGFHLGCCNTQFGKGWNWNQVYKCRNTQPIIFKVISEVHVKDLALLMVQKFRPSPAIRVTHYFVQSFLDPKWLVKRMSNASKGENNGFYQVPTWKTGMLRFVNFHQLGFTPQKKQAIQLPKETGTNSYVFQVSRFNLERLPPPLSFIRIYKTASWEAFRIPRSNP